MKTISNVLLPLALVVSFNATATECASVSIEDTDQHLFRLSANNYQSVDVKKYRKSDRYDANYNYYLASGKHTLSFAKWRKKDFKALKRGNQLPKGFTNPLPTIAAINVTSNKHYLLASKNDSGELYVKAVNEQTCDTSGLALLPSRQQANVVALELPEQLQHRLDQLMKVSNGQRNLVPANIVSYFGAIAASNSSDLTILAVTPRSPAQRLGLRSGDKVVQLGGKALTFWKDDKLDPLANYIHKTRAGDLIEISINRSGEHMNINGAFEPTIIPQFEYEFDNRVQQTLVSTSGSNDRLHAAIAQLVLEIKMLPDAQLNSHVDGFLIEREKSYDIKYGIQGDMVNLGNNYGFKVNYVQKKSAASVLGIKTGDIISSVNGKMFSDNDISLVAKSIEQLNDNEVYNVNIKRNNRLEQLKGKYSRIEIPAYRLMIDQQSQLAMAAILKDSKNLSRHDYKQMNRLKYWIAADINSHETTYEIDPDFFPNATAGN